MKRQQLIQQIFEATKFKTYLEIGCYKGHAFFPLNAKVKIAVDPAYHPLFYLNHFKYFFKNLFKTKTHVFKLTSDDFFKKHQNFLKAKAPMDAVLIDGLHTFETSLNDVLNVLPFLNAQGIVVMHDCLPPNEAAALPTKRFPTQEDLVDVNGWTGAWCGDVWKTIVYLKQAYPTELEVLVIDTDNGLGIIRLKRRGAVAFNGKVDKQLFNDIDKKDYQELMRHVNAYLNLKEKSYVYQLINEFKETKSVNFS